MKIDIYKEAEKHIKSGYYSPIEGFELGANWMRDEAKSIVEDISAQLMNAHDSEDWQEVAHIALDVMPRLFKDYGN